MHHKVIHMMFFGFSKIPSSSPQISPSPPSWDYNYDIWGAESQTQTSNSTTTQITTKEHTSIPEEAFSETAEPDFTNIPPDDFDELFLNSDNEMMDEKEYAPSQSEEDEDEDEEEKVEQEGREVEEEKKEEIEQKEENKNSKKRKNSSKEVRPQKNQKTLTQINENRSVKSLRNKVTPRDYQTETAKWMVETEQKEDLKGGWIIFPTGSEKTGTHGNGFD